MGLVNIQTLLVNYYRTREINHHDEISGLDDPIIKVPVLFIQALQDQALPHRGMEHFIPQLTTQKVEATHWVLWEEPEQVNRILSTWLGSYFTYTSNPAS
jgi:pimeloyl-ACP methyl ester carboxylesterase